MNKSYFNIVIGCGNENRTIVRYHDTCYIGCFTGTYTQAAEAIRKKYIGVSCDAYIKKLNVLYSSSISDDMVTAQDNYALKWTSRNGYLEMVKYLVARGADVTAGDNYALRWAFENGYMDVVKWLITHGAGITVDNNCVLERVTENEYTTIMKWVTEYLNHTEKEHIMGKPDFNIVTKCGEYQRTIYRYQDRCYIGCSNYSYKEAIKAINKKYEGIELVDYIKKIDMLYTNSVTTEFTKDYINEALQFPPIYGHLDVLKWLVSQGGKILTESNYSARMAATNGNLNILKYLASQNIDIKYADNYPLRAACASGYIDIVKWYIENGADVTMSDNYLIYVASTNFHLDVVKYLESKGGDITARKGRPMIMVIKHIISETGYPMWMIGSMTSDMEELKSIYDRMMTIYFKKIDT